MAFRSLAPEVKFYWKLAARFHFKAQFSFVIATSSLRVKPKALLQA